MISYLFFKGCTIPASLPNVEKLALDILPEIGINLIESDEFTCCPDPIRLQGTSQYFWMASAARNIAIAEEKKLDIMTLCNGCENTLAIVNYKMKNNSELRRKVNEALKEIGREFQGTVKIKHFLQVLKEDIGLDNLKKMIRIPLTGLKVAGHPGCHLLMPNEILKFDNPVDPEFYDKFIAALGATPVDYLTKSDCCGISLSLAGDKEASNQCIQNKLIDVQLSGAQIISTACPACFNQFDFGQFMLSRDNPRLKEKPIPVLYAIELLALAMGRSFEEIGYNLHRVRIPVEEKI
ncbi:MAG: CoB--CoM heterodisulfide reductase iron-sulfur subunit B family protein [Atribacterota bacterium]|nr:CoB--CoM heterodisulfide reductase iron-sulfur subunit B family protein [Atribacterota bacterium]MDD4895474.1 CoB--CoM heterodisulfide reductase iron-sulfur subunit B family protein [Atribacterota bacterium]MDD5637891.1 CoB--CoM heterodisulfide reductase iron-sulfur subunit B family protein [Atribacterota bacterium]